MIAVVATSDGVVAQCMHPNVATCTAFGSDDVASSYSTALLNYSKVAFPTAASYQDIQTLMVCS